MPAFERTDLGGAMIIGMAGAKGVWTMTGGTATLSGCLYVGGITTAFADVEFLKDDGAEYTCKITDTTIRISSNIGGMLIVR